MFQGYINKMYCFSFPTLWARGGTWLLRHFTARGPWRSPPAFTAPSPPPSTTRWNWPRTTTGGVNFLMCSPKFPVSKKSWITDNFRWPSTLTQELCNRTYLGGWGMFHNLYDFHNLFWWKGQKINKSFWLVIVGEHGQNVGLVIFSDILAFLWVSKI